MRHILTFSISALLIMAGLCLVLAEQTNGFNLQTFVVVKTVGLTAMVVGYQIYKIAFTINRAKHGNTLRYKIALKLNRWLR